MRISRRGGASALLADAGGVWVAHRGTGLQRLGAGAPEPVGGFGRPRELVGLARAAGELWLLDFGDWPASRHRGVLVDAEGERRIRLGHAPAAVAAAGGRLWVTNNLDGTLSRIDPSAARVEETIRVGDGPVGVVAGHGAVWVANTGDGTVSRVDPRTSRVTATIRVGSGPRGLAVADDGVWVANSLDDTVSRIDPATDTVAETLPVGAGPTAVAAGAHALWVANLHDGTVTRIAR
jgi:YVTN family beta-propeller protein